MHAHVRPTRRLFSWREDGDGRACEVGVFGGEVGKGTRGLHSTVLYFSPHSGKGREGGGDWSGWIGWKVGKPGIEVGVGVEIGMQYGDGHRPACAIMPASRYEAEGVIRRLPVGVALPLSQFCRMTAGR